MGQIVIVDYGMGNIRSMANAIEAVSGKSLVKVSQSARDIEAADRVVFPGQGAMVDCLRELDNRCLRETIIEATKTKPFLGVCIGLQMLFDFSQENGGNCLGVLQGNVVRFTDGLVDEGKRLKVPHMGWNNVEQVAWHPLWAGIPDHSRFYFVHSYYVEAANNDILFGVSRYPEAFHCAVGFNNVFAVQFHPEKSQSVGLRLLSNFVNWDGCTS